MEFDKEKFIEVFMRAKVFAYITRSRDSEKEKLLEKLREKAEELLAMAEEVVKDAK